MPPPRSIAIITSLAFSLANFRGALIRELVAAGIVVYCLAPDYDDRSREMVRALGAEPIDISLERTGMKPLRDLLDMVRLTRQLHALKPDATFGYFIKAVLYGTPAAAIAGTRRRYVLIPGLGYIFTEASISRKRRVLRRAAEHFYRIALRFAQVVFFQNADDLHYFVDRGIVPFDKCTLLAGSGVDLTFFARTPFPETEGPVFLLVARLLREKGIAEFVEAARMLRAENVKARWVLAGGLDPNPGGFSIDEVRGWATAGDIEWLGHIDDIRSVIAASSVFVLPSYREGKPRSTQEAMAMGRAVITTDAPGCRDTVEEGVNGFKVPVRDAIGLANAMRRFVIHPALMASMGAESRRMAVETYDVHRINAEMLAAMAIDPAEKVARKTSTRPREDG